MEYLRGGREAWFGLAFFAGGALPVRGTIHLEKPMTEKEPPTVEWPPNKKGDGKRPPTVAEQKSSQVKSVGVAGWGTLEYFGGKGRLKS